MGANRLDPRRIAIRAATATTQGVQQQRQRLPARKTSGKTGLHSAAIAQPTSPGMPFSQTLASETVCSLLPRLQSILQILTSRIPHSEVPAQRADRTGQLEDAGVQVALPLHQLIIHHLNITPPHP